MVSKGADAGDSSAQTNLGYMYDQGLGCPRSPSNAALWYRKAADAGDPLGENNLADLYLRGEGVAQNDAEAFRLFQKAALQGQTGARIKLGYMYAEGRGTQQDRQTAYAWISAASLAGDPRGNDLLHSLQKVLSPEQLVRAQEQAERLRSEHPPQLSANAFAP
jgi:TPR repeat protein